MSVSLRQNSAAALAGLQTQAATRVLAAALALQAQHKRELNVSNPSPHRTPAPRGAYPRKRTGWLQAHTLVSPLSVQGVVAAGGVVRVGYEASAFYGDALAARGWLGVADTAQRMRAQLTAVIGGAQP